MARAAYLENGVVKGDDVEGASCSDEGFFQTYTGFKRRESKALWRRSRWNSKKLEKEEIVVSGVRLRSFKAVAWLEKRVRPVAKQNDAVD